MESVDPQFTGVSSKQLYEQLMQIQAHWTDTSGRKEWFEADQGRQQETRSVVSLVHSAQLRSKVIQGVGAFELEADPLRSRRIDYYGQQYPLCEGTPYLDQPMGAFCSGVLVSRRVVATAAHCIATDADVSNTRFVFDFRMTDRSHAVSSFHQDEVYEGKRIIHPHTVGPDDDWQLIELTRDVTDSTRVATLRSGGSLDSSHPIYAFGHPNGLPVKISGGGRVQDNSDPSYFVAGIDVFSGNSGGPVLSDQHVVEGLLVRGDTDYIPVDACMAVNNCPSGSGCRGDEIIRTTKFSDFIKP